MFKCTRIAAILALVLPLAVAGMAEARPGGSFRGGFSSGKSSVARSVATPRQPAFGSFGKRPAEAPKAAPAPQRNSAFSRDLDRNSARDQALRTYDARRGATGAAAPDGAGRGAAAATPPLPPLDPVMPGGRGGGNGGHGGYHGGYAQSGSTSAPAPVVVRDSNNGWLWGIGGFMLGRAAGAGAAPPPAQAPAPAVTADPAAYPAVASPGATVAAPAKSEGSWLGKIALLALVGGLAWLTWKAFRIAAGGQEVKKHANYKFERN